MKPFSLVIPAAGGGSRFGGSVAKQFLLLANGSSVLEHVVSQFAHMDACQEIVVVLPPKAPVLTFQGKVTTCVGGAERSASVANGLDQLTCPDDGLVLVHDAARPLVWADDIEALTDAWVQDEGVYLAGASVDTLRDAQGRTLDRTTINRVYTPQGASLKHLRNALATGQGTDEVTFLQNAGVHCRAVLTERLNIKITFTQDLPVVNALLKDVPCE